MGSEEEISIMGGRGTIRTLFVAESPRATARSAAATATQRRPCWSLSRSSASSETEKLCQLEYYQLNSPMESMQNTYFDHLHLTFPSFQIFL